VLLQQAECAELEDVLPTLFGYHLVQIGCPYGADLLVPSRISHRITLDVDGGANNGSPLCARADATPLATDSVDLLILPHTLEFEHDPHQVLREARRMLIADGHVVIIGFNPWSLWGAWRIALSHRGGPPWCGRFFSMTRVKDWLSLLNFDVVRSKMFFYRPPLQSERIMRRLSFLEAAGRRAWPGLGAAYVLVAKKKVIPLTPYRPRWLKRRSLLAAGAIEPSARRSKGD